MAKHIYSGKLSRSLLGGMTVGLLFFTGSCRTVKTGLSAEIDGGKQVVTETASYSDPRDERVEAVVKEAPPQSLLSAAIPPVIPKFRKSQNQPNRADDELRPLEPVSRQSFATSSIDKEPFVTIPEDIINPVSLDDDIKVSLAKIPDPVLKEEVGNGKIKGPSDLLASTRKKSAKPPINVEVNGMIRIIEAEGQDITVNGLEGVIIIRGKCGKLTLAGRKNRVQCDAADVIEVTGDRNTLVMGVIGNGTITGNRNDLSWGSALRGEAPDLESNGIDNRIRNLD